MQNLLWILRETKYEERQAEQPLIFVFIDEKGKETMISTWWNETVSSPKRGKQIKEIRNVIILKPESSVQRKIAKNFRLTRSKSSKMVVENGWMDG